MEVDDFEIYLGYCPTCKIQELRVSDLECGKCGTPLKRIDYQTYMGAWIDLDEWCKGRDSGEATREAVLILINHAKANLMEGSYFEIRECRADEDGSEHAIAWFHDKSIVKEEVVYQEPKFNPPAGAFIWSRHRV